MHVLKTDDASRAGKTIAQDINARLAKGEKVLWLVAGGSALKVAQAAGTHMIPNENLEISLTDERYGKVGFADSNEKQLRDLGFTLPMYSILHDVEVEETALSYDAWLRSIVTSHTVVGLYGMGPDGHIAGILPKSLSAYAEKGLAVEYVAALYHRITTTKAVFDLVDTAYLWIQGEDKQEAYTSLFGADLDEAEQPAQIVKRARRVILFSSLKMPAGYRADK